MPDASTIMLILVILAALAFDYVNGFHDTANAIATSVSTRALSIKSAICLAAILNFAGAMASTKVASTIGKGIVDPTTITQMIVLSGILGAIIWDVITWYYGLPSSSSHAIVGGLIGAVVAGTGSFQALHAAGLKKIILSLIISPVIGTVLGFFFVVLFTNIVKKGSPYAINKGFRRMQVMSASFLAFAHGTADAQKSMGVITMALLSHKLIPAFDVPLWVKISCATAMAIGTAAGGWRIIKTVGSDFVKLQPMTGFSVDSSAAAVILSSSAFGLPTSTTHVITSSILGVGLSKRLNAVNWDVAGRIMTAWILTIPASAVVAYICYQLLSPFLGK